MFDYAEENTKIFLKKESNVGFVVLDNEVAAVNAMTSGPHKVRNQNISLVIPEAQVHVRGLGGGVGEDDVGQSLEQFGKLVWVRRPQKDGRPAGFAFVQFASEMSARSAIQMGTVFCKGRSLFEH